MINNLVNSRRDEEDGFTLVELLAVIAILGILAGIAVFGVSGLGDRGKGSACEASVKTIETAQEAHYAQKGSYAASVTALQTAGFIKSAPSVDGYTFSTSSTGGASSSPAC